MGIAAAKSDNRGVSSLLKKQDWVRNRSHVRISTDRTWRRICYAWAPRCVRYAAATLARGGRLRDLSMMMTEMIERGKRHNPPLAAPISAQ